MSGDLTPEKMQAVSAGLEDIVDRWNEVAEEAEFLLIGGEQKMSLHECLIASDDHQNVVRGVWALGQFPGGIYLDISTQADGTPHRGILLVIAPAPRAQTTRRHHAAAAAAYAHAFDLPAAVAQTITDALDEAEHAGGSRHVHGNVIVAATKHKKPMLTCTAAVPLGGATHPPGGYPRFVADGWIHHTRGQTCQTDHEPDHGP